MAGGVTVLPNGRIMASAAWFAANNPILALGQEAYEYDTRKVKLGDGAAAYTTLAFNSEPGTSTLNVAQTTLAGTTAGNIVWSQPFNGSAYKKVLAYLGGYRNSTATAQTITYPVAFTNVPRIVSDDSGGSTTTVTTLTLPASMAAVKTGWIVIEGY